MIKHASSGIPPTPREMVLVPAEESREPSRDGIVGESRVGEDVEGGEGESLVDCEEEKFVS